MAGYGLKAANAIHSKNHRKIRMFLKVKAPEAIISHIVDSERF
jgi:hypothetical protein